MLDINKICIFVGKFLIGKMRILYITDALAVWGGIERVLRDKMNYLVEHYGYDVHIVTTDQGDHPIPYPLDERIHVHDLGIQFHHQYRHRGIKRLIEYRRLNRLFEERLKNCIEEIKPDVIDCIRIEFVSVVINAKGTIPLVCESHSLCKAAYFENSSVWNRLRLHLSYRKLKNVDMMVALTQGDANDWKKYCKNVCVIPNAVHLNDTGRYANLDSKIAIFVGRFSEQKDFGALIEIWKIVHLHHPDWMLHAYGEGAQRDYYEKVIHELNITIKIFPPTSDIFDKYLESSMLLMTSRYEPFGLVLPEAMSCGLPVVAFNCPYGPADIIINGTDGMLIDNRDIRIYADSVCKLVENDQMRKLYGFNSVKSVLRFKVEQIMPMWNSLFAMIVS